MVQDRTATTSSGKRVKDSPYSGREPTCRSRCVAIRAEQDETAAAAQITGEWRGVPVLVCGSASGTLA